MPETCAPAPHRPIPDRPGARPLLDALDALRADADALRSRLEDYAARVPEGPLHLHQSRTVHNRPQFIDGIVTDTLHGPPAARDRAQRDAAALHALAQAHA